MEGTTKIFIGVFIVFLVLLGVGVWMVRSGVFAAAFAQPSSDVEFGVVYVQAVEEGVRTEIVRTVLDNGAVLVSEVDVPTSTPIVPFSFAMQGGNFSYEYSGATGVTAVRVPVIEQGLRVLVYADGHYAGSPYLAAWGDNHTLVVPLSPFPKVNITFTPAVLEPQRAQEVVLHVQKSGWAESLGVCFDWTPEVVWATFAKAVVTCDGAWVNTTGRMVGGVAESYPSGLFRCPANENRTAVCSAVEGNECILSGGSIPKRLEKDAVKCFDLDIATPDAEITLPLVVKTADVTSADKVRVYVYDKEQYFVDDERMLIRERKVDGVWVDVGMPDVLGEVYGK